MSQFNNTFVTIQRPNGSTYRIYYRDMCPAAQSVFDGDNPHAKVDGAIKRFRQSIMSQEHQILNPSFPIEAVNKP